MLLTVSIRPHLGYVGASQEAYNTKVLLTKGAQESDLGLILDVAGSRWRYASFEFRLEFLVCGDLMTGRFHQFLLIQNELSQDKFD